MSDLAIQRCVLSSTLPANQGLGGAVLELLIRVYLHLNTESMCVCVCVCVCV